VPAVPLIRCPRSICRAGRFNSDSAVRITARDLGFEITGQADAVLERLVPALDLALGLGMARSTANMGQAAAR